MNNNWIELNSYEIEEESVKALFEANNKIKSNFMNKKPMTSHLTEK